MNQNTMHPNAAARPTGISTRHKNPSAWRTAGLTLVGTLLLLGTVEAQQAQRRALPNTAGAKAANPKQAAIEKKLDTIIFPATDFPGTSLEEAVDKLRSCAKEQDQSTADPAQKGVNFMIRAPRGFQAGRIELKLEKMTLRKALENITEASGTRFQVDESGITVMPKAAPPEPAPKSGNPTALKDSAKKIVIPVINFEDATLKDAVDFLNQQTNELAKGDPGFTVKIDPDKVDGSTPVKELRLRNASALEALKYLADATHTMLTAGDKVIWVTRQ